MTPSGKHAQFEHRVAKGKDGTDSSNLLPLTVKQFVGCGWVFSRKKHQGPSYRVIQINSTKL